MTEFVALRLSSFPSENLMELGTRNVKESRKCVVKKTLLFEDNKNCLLANSGDVYRSQLMFRSKKHEVHTIEVNKIALNRDHDKRISNKDGISSLARGHKSLPWSPILSGELRPGSRPKSRFCHIFVSLSRLNRPMAVKFCTGVELIRVSRMTV